MWGLDEVFKFYDFIGKALLICFPLAIWKIIEIIIWLVQHLKISID